MQQKFRRVAFALCIIFVFLLQLSVLFAGPPPPPDPPETIGGAVFIVEPSSTAEPDLDVVYSHTFSGTTLCNLSLDGSFMSGRSRVVPKDTLQTESLSGLSAGSHRFDVTCSNGTSGAGASKTVTISGGGDGMSVSILSPPSTAGPTLDVIYTHTGSGTVTCNLSLDGSFMSGRSRVVAMDALQTESLFGLSAGSHRFDVNCSSATNDAGAYKIVMVSTEANALTITPLSTYAGLNVTIQGTFDALSSVFFTITPPSGTGDVNTLSTDAAGVVTLAYTIPTSALAGAYTVSGVANGVTKTGSFTVLTRSPSIMLAGNKTNVSAGFAVVIVGSDFTPSTSVSLILTGSEGKTATALSDSTGGFSYTFPKLKAGSYSLIASAGSLVASITFTVTGAAVVDKPIDDPDDGIIDENDVPDEEEQEDEVETEIETNDGTNDDIDDSDTLPVDEETPFEERPSGLAGNLLVWIIPAAIFVIIGGLFGYFVYSGAIDMSSGEAFKESISGVFHGNFSSHHQASHVITPEERQTLHTFITTEREKGYDDLTIHSALLAKGWDRNEVDKIFAEMYMEK